jgi:hypothetical protein
MPCRLAVVAVLACFAGPLVAQTAPPGPAAPPFGERFGAQPPGGGALSPAQAPLADEAISPSTERVDRAAVMRDLQALPAPVRETRERIIAAARTGEPSAVQRIVAANRVRVRLDTDPIEDAELLWRSQYPDSEGREALAILLDTLDMPFVRVDAGTPQEMYVWPAFAHMPLDELRPPEMVELYRLVTAYDLQQMVERGAWTFFRLGIAPDGVWHYFIAGE